MIHELYLYLTESVDHRAKSFGHLKESIALIKRQKRCESFWKSHQENCRKSILSFATKIDVKNSILILGSGPLHEIPIEEISKLFTRVILVDIVHLKSTRKRVSHLTNITFIEHDITEIENNLKNKSIKNIEPVRFLNEQFDFVVSANLLSQLPYHLKNYILKNKFEIDELQLDQFCFQVSLDHFNYLNKFNCPVLLITDIESHYKNIAKNQIEIETPYINFLLPEISQEWWWDVAPAPEINPQISLQMKVVSIILN